MHLVSCGLEASHACTLTLLVPNVLRLTETLKAGHAQAVIRYAVLRSWSTSKKYLSKHKKIQEKGLEKCVCPGVVTAGRRNINHSTNTRGSVFTDVSKRMKKVWGFKTKIWYKMKQWEHNYTIKIINVVNIMLQYTTLRQLNGIKSFMQKAGCDRL